MDTVALSPDFNVVIPAGIRRSLGLSAGEKLRVLSYAGRVELIPVRNMNSLRGFLPGMDAAIERDVERT